MRDTPSRMITRRPAIAIALAMLVSAATVYACTDGGDPATWSLDKASYDLGGSSAMLSPGNDTRANMLLMLADRRGATVRDSKATQIGPPLVMMSWRLMAAATEPYIPGPSTVYDPARDTRCQSSKSGGAAFVAALQRNRSIPAAEQGQLVAVRQALDPKCDGSATANFALTLQSPAGRDFATYLAGTADFYAGKFEQAGSRFGALANSADPWLRETARYMVARTAINLAQDRSIDKYGDLAEPAERDQPAIAAAGKAFQAYLAAYPDGRYAGSARGLMRRVHFFAGDGASLAAEYDRLIAAGPSAPDLDFIEEIDDRLSPADAIRTRDPILTAVSDLQRMRDAGEWDKDRSCCGPPLTKAELEAQRPLFGKDVELFDFLRAAHAYYVDHQPRTALALLPDAANQQRFTYLQFSRQMLRGLALDAVKDPNTRDFWLSLLPGAVQPYQRGAVELAVALHDERSGNLAATFAPGSPVRHPVMRTLLLEHVADPDLLRRQASATSAAPLERHVALYILLAKQLQRGFYRDFLADVRLVPAKASTEDYYGGAQWYDPTHNAELGEPPLGVFGPAAKLGDFGCPALTATVEQLAASPGAIRPRLCLAEYFRGNGFDQFAFDQHYGERQLGSSPSQFPGRPYQRIEVYTSVTADPAASADDKALALNRAIRCYAPSGSSSCGGTEVDEAQRKAWFTRLKKEYPTSRWARSLKLYW